MEQGADVRTIRFDNNITDELLEDFFGKERVAEVRRGVRISEVDVYSEEPVETVTKRLEHWYKDWKKNEEARLAEVHSAIYDQRVKDLYDGVPGLPISRSNSVTGKKEHGYSILDDDGKFQNIWYD